MNVFQQNTLLNFLFQCRFRPVVSKQLKNLGLKERVFKGEGMQEGLGKLLNGIIEADLFEEGEKKGFIGECEAMDFKFNKSWCDIF